MCLSGVPLGAAAQQAAAGAGKPTDLPFLFLEADFEATRPDPNRALDRYRAGAFRESAGTSVPLEGEKKAAWIAIQEWPPTPDDEPGVLIVYPPRGVIDRVDVYFPIAGAGFEHRSAGLLQPARSPRVDYRYPAFLVPGALDESRPTLVYVADRLTNGASPRFRSLADLQRADHRFQFFSLLFFGMIAGLGVYNFFVFVWLRDVGYLYYVLHLFAASLFLYCVEGLISETPVALVAALGPKLSYIAASASYVFTSLFVGAFAELDRYTPRLWRYVVKPYIYLILLQVALVGTGIVPRNTFATKLMDAEGLLGSVVLLTCAYLAWRRGSRAGLYYLTSNTLVFASVIYRLLYIYGFFTNDFFFDHGVQMALAVEAMILSVGLTQRISDLRIQRDLNAKRADFDPITMLPNRQHIRSQGQKLFARARKRKTTLAVMFLDIDHFKRINDTYGHATGDEVLCTVANRCRGALRSAELMGRYGGDEFIVFFPGARPGDPEIIGRRLVDFVGATPVATSEGESIAVTISAGVALLEPTTTSLDELVELADKALYDAKGSGRDRLTMSGIAGG